MNPVDAGVPVVLPTLTEVVDPGDFEAARREDDGEVDAEADEALPAAAPLAEAAPLPSADELVRRVMAELDRQIDVMLEYRLREVLAPLLSRTADNLVRDARAELASTLRDVVTRAVASELARHRTRPAER